MTSRRKFIGLLGGGVVVFGAAAVAAKGLGDTPAQVSAYPAIRYGEETCSFCGMSIDDARFASAWRVPSGPERHFDDIGCMVSAFHRDRPADGVQFYVHDYQAETWLDATSAHFVVSRSIKTPMAYGVAARATAADADALAQQSAAAPAQAWSEMAAHLERKS
jgi:copper chaperone NosL